MTRLDGASESVNVGALTIRDNVVVAVRLPEVPVTVTVYVPGVTLLPVVSVSTLEPVEAGFGAKEAVTPLGNPEAAMLTLPLNPLMELTSIVDVPEAFWPMDMFPEFSSVKLGERISRSGMTVAEREPEVPVMTSG